MGAHRWVLWEHGAMGPQAGTVWHRQGWQALATCLQVCHTYQHHVCWGRLPGWVLTEGTGTVQEPGLHRVVPILLAMLPAAMDLPSNISADRAPLPSPLLLPVPCSCWDFPLFK